MLLRFFFPTCEHWKTRLDLFTYIYQVKLRFPWRHDWTNTHVIHLVSSGKPRTINLFNNMLFISYLQYLHISGYKPKRVLCGYQIYIVKTIDFFQSFCEKIRFTINKKNGLCWFSSTLIYSAKNWLWKIKFSFYNYSSRTQKALPFYKDFSGKTTEPKPFFKVFI